MLAYLKESDIQKHGYVKRQYSLDVANALKTLRVPIVPLWKAPKWHFYCKRLDGYYYQCSSPDGNLTTGTIEWLKRQDQTQHGTLDDKGRVDYWTKWFLHTALLDEQTRRDKIQEATDWETTQRCNFIENRFYRPYHQKPYLYVPTGIVGRLRSGKRVTLCKKVKHGRQSG